MLLETNDIEFRDVLTFRFFIDNGRKDVSEVVGDVELICNKITVEKLASMIIDVFKIVTFLLRFSSGRIDVPLTLTNKLFK